MKHLRKFSKKKTGRIGRFTDIQRLYKMIKNHPCYVDSLKFPKVPEEIYIRYLALRNKRAFERKGEYINQKDAAKVMTYNIKEKWDKLIEKVNEGKLKKPTNKIIADLLLHDPTRNKLIASDQTVRGWVAEFEKILGKKEEKIKLEEKKEVVPDIVKSAMEIKEQREDKNI